MYNTFKVHVFTEIQNIYKLFVFIISNKTAVMVELKRNCPVRTCHM